MTFFLDENFPRSAAALLLRHGHEVVDSRDVCDSGTGDDVLFSKAQDLEAVFLTTDRDFFHTVPHQWKVHAGVIVIALRQPSRSAILSRLEWFLQSTQPESICGRVYQLRDTTYVRR